MQKNVNLMDKEVASQLKKIDENFLKNFEEIHKEFKKLIHLCQYLKYSNQESSLLYAENESRKCFLPFMVMRRHFSSIMNSNKEKLDECIHVKSFNKSSVACVSNYKKKLYGHKPLVTKLYKGYIQNLITLTIQNPGIETNKSDQSKQIKNVKLIDIDKHVQNIFI